MNGDSGRRRLRFAYYCSGHGFGHATRVVAIALALLEARHHVSIVTNAPQWIFEPCIAQGADYRQAAIDAGIVQPKAYDVDRQATLRILQAFLQARPEKLQTEMDFLKRQRIDAVLVDAPFLPCAAAAAAIVSNFTFDSCYSYLSTPSENEDGLDPALLRPLVDATVADYACASLLLRLPGAIPIPAFDVDVPLPSISWVDHDAHAFVPQIDALLSKPPGRVFPLPLVARKQSVDVHSRAFRSALLTRLGVPDEKQDPETTKILLVSFGGQAIPRPTSRPSSPAIAQFGPDRPSPTRAATLHHIYAPGAPPALHHAPDPPSLLTVDNEIGLLPDGWIAIVAGMSGSTSTDGANDLADATKNLPPNFYIAPQDVYVPDLTAISAVVLGKLGYGTCSETLSTRTPFVYVPRPLFVEEFGLKRLMLSRGVCIHLNRAAFEEGRWSDKVLEAYALGKQEKTEERKGVRGALAAEDDRAGQIAVEELEKWLGS